MLQDSVDRSAQPVTDAGLAPATRFALRCFLDADRRDVAVEAQLAAAQLAAAQLAAAQHIADEALRRGVAAERMVIALKHEWGTMNTIPDRIAPDARDRLSRFVTLAIRAYYHADRDGRHGECEAMPTRREGGGASM